MGTIVNSMSNLYFDLYVGDMFNMDEANRILGKYSDVKRRINYIKAVYETVLGSSIINETTKILIKSRKSYVEVARYYNSLHADEIQRTKEAEEQDEKINCPVHAKTEALVKSDVCYTNKKLKNVLGCNIPYCSQKDFFNVVMWKSEMDDALWLQAEEALELLKAMCNGSLLSKEALWLNIPVREFNKELSVQEFQHLVDLIKPYFTTQKALAQLELNEMKREAGYLNYILRADMELNEVDCARRDYILSLTDSSLVRNKKDPGQGIENKRLAELQKQLLQLKEIQDVEKKTRVEIMSKIGFVYYSNKTGVFTELQMEQLEAFEREYERLKEVEQKRLEEIRLLQVDIEKLKEQEYIIKQLKGGVDEQYIDF
uniref:hypothetical protein n=1 Tax=Acetatifactor sp. TaxID=1872090 RepID=UPI004056CD6B